MICTYIYKHDVYFSSSLLHLSSLTMNTSCVYLKFFCVLNFCDPFPLKSMTVRTSNLTMSWMPLSSIYTVLMIRPALNRCWVMTKLIPSFRGWEQIGQVGVHTCISSTVSQWLMMVDSVCSCCWLPQPFGVIARISCHR